MITLFNSKDKKVKSFQNDDELFQYITDTENNKMLECHKYFAETEWRFDIYKPRDVYELYHQTQKELITPTLKYAYEQQLGILEICMGDYQNPAEVLIIPDLDIENYKKKWCRSYCKAHGYRIVEHKEKSLVSPKNINKEDEQ